MSDLLSVDNALEQLLRAFNRLPAETVALEQAHGRVLAADVTAAEDIPSFANSSMDGFAVRSADVASAGPTQPVQLPVTFDIPAGSAPTAPLLPGTAARIMTGAPLPEGADAVVPVEATNHDGRDQANRPLPENVLIFQSVTAGSSVRAVGDDIRAGQRVLSSGTRIRAAEMGLLAGLGAARVPCVRQPRVAILSSGDELLAPDEPLMPGKIRDMNTYALAALVEEHGGIAVRLPPARDTLDDVRARFQQALDVQPDLIVSSAGVSVGTADLVRTVLEELGSVSFWRVNLRPGKPFAFGHLAGIPFFGLPGNPVSAMITFDVFVRPCLLRLTGGEDLAQVAEAIVGEDIPSDGRRTYVRIRLAQDAGQWVARTTGTQSSSAILSMVLADGLLIMPEGMTLARAGERLPVRLLRR